MTAKTRPPGATTPEEALRQRRAGIYAALLATPKVPNVALHPVRDPNSMLSEAIVEAVADLEEEGESLSGVATCLAGVMDNWHRNPAMHSDLLRSEAIGRAQDALRLAAQLMLWIEEDSADV